MSLVAGRWIELTGAHREPGAFRAPRSLVWIRGDAPTDSERALLDRWLVAEGLSHETIDRLLGSPRAHLERGERAFAIVLDTLALDERDDVTTGHVVCVFAPRVIVTVAMQPTDLLDQTEQTVRRSPHPRGREAVMAILGSLLTEVLSAAEEVEVGLSAAINDVEQAMFTQHLTDPVARIYSLKRQVSRADYALGALARPLERLTEGDDMPFRDKASRGRLRRLSEWAHRLSELLGVDDQMLGDMLQVHLTQVSVRQNEDMRKISAWAGLVAVPTLISGVYGMNFESIPWLREEWGFPVVMGAMVAVCLVLYRLFKRSGWL